MQRVIAVGLIGFLILGGGIWWFVEERLEQVRRDLPGSIVIHEWPVGPQVLSLFGLALIAVSIARGIAKLANRRKTLG